MMKSNIKKVETSCNNCGSSESELVTTGSEHEYDNTTDDVFNVVQCTGCGLCYLNPRPDISELTTIYPPNYYAYSLEDGGLNGHNLYSRIRYAAIMHGLETALKRFFPDRESIKMLDIGCGNGFVLDCFKNIKSYRIETHGIDIGVEAIEKARAKGHVTYCGRFEEIDLPSGLFDFVYASHVIEHVPDPRAFTSRVYEILKPGGVFAFWTPNIDSVEARWFRNKHWGQYHFPRHWFFYCPKTIRDLAGLTGFELEDINFQPNGVSWVFTFHSICKSRQALAKYADALFPTVDWSQTTAANFLRNGFFVVVELVLKLFTGRTSNMGVAFRKPARISRSDV